MTALETATFDDGTSCPGAHPRSKAMLALPAACVRLIGTFHGKGNPNRVYAVGGRLRTALTYCQRTCEAPSSGMRQRHRSRLASTRKVHLWRERKPRPKSVLFASILPRTCELRIGDNPCTTTLFDFAVRWRSVPIVWVLPILNQRGPGPYTPSAGCITFPLHFPRTFRRSAPSDVFSTGCG
jgi:hypothetical protein